MKRVYIIRFIFSILAMVFLLSSCDDFLDRSPLGSFTEDDAPAGVNQGNVFAVYALMRSYNITAGIPAFAVHNFRSEDSEKGSTSSDGADQAAMWDNFEYSASNGLISAYWTQNYTIIYQCNSIIDAIENASTTTAEDIINIGEAKFFRAYCYFNLVRAFGEVPKIDFKVVTSADANIPKSSAEEIYELIDADLKDAEEYLPESWNSTYTGRLTWGAARSLHARTYMMRSDWPNMLAASQDVINSGLYNLDTSFDQIFTDEGENCSESIFELQCTATSALPASTTIGSQFCQVQGVRGSGQWNLGWGWHMATVELGQAFETGDPRKDATLLYFRRSESEAITPENTNKPYGESPISSGMGGYYNKKAYTNPQMRTLYANSGFWVNIRLIRYADVVLMAAEAANELGQASIALDYCKCVAVPVAETTPFFPRLLLLFKQI